MTQQQADAPATTYPVAELERRFYAFAIDRLVTWGLYVAGGRRRLARCSATSRGGSRRHRRRAPWCVGWLVLAVMTGVSGQHPGQVRGRACGSSTTAPALPIGVGPALVPLLSCWPPPRCRPSGSASRPSPGPPSRTAAVSAAAGTTTSPSVGRGRRATGRRSSTSRRRQPAPRRQPHRDAADPRPAGRAAGVQPRRGQPGAVRRAAPRVPPPPSSRRPSSRRAARSRRHRSTPPGRTRRPQRAAPPAQRPPSSTAARTSPPAPAIRVRRRRPGPHRGPLATRRRRPPCRPALAGDLRRRALVRGRGPGAGRSSPRAALRRAGAPPRAADLGGHVGLQDARPVRARPPTASSWSWTAARPTGRC